MTYEQRLYNLIEEIKADKSFPNPWRNYVGSDGVRLQALIRMGEQTTLREVPEGLLAAEEKAMTGFDPRGPNFDGCICPNGGVRLDCPIAEHRAKAARV